VPNLLSLLVNLTDFYIFQPKADTLCASVDSSVAGEKKIKHLAEPQRSQRRAGLVGFAKEDL
jgi:hypothetical protein